MVVPMTYAKRLTQWSIVVGLIAGVLACGAAPSEGYYDRDHHRYYHERAWHECVEHDEHCR
jgi:uncharacterized membrane protein